MESQLSHRVTVFRPQAAEIRLSRFTGADGPERLYVELAPGMDVCLGMYENGLADDLAAMRALAATAAEAVRVLEERQAAARRTETGSWAAEANTVPRTEPGPCTGPGCDHASHASRPAMIP